MVAWLAVARAFDPAPAVFAPSAAPGEPAIEAQMGPRGRRLLERADGTIGGTLTASVGRLSLGGEYGGAGPGLAVRVASGWAGVALVHAPRVRVTAWARGGTVLQAGLSAVARTRAGGIGGYGYTFDLSGGPAWATDRLLGPSWGRPLDALESLPEAGVSTAIHPNGSQHVRVGLLGPMPTATWRLEADWFVLESMAGGLPGVGGVFLTAGGRWPADR